MRDTESDHGGSLRIQPSADGKTVDVSCLIRGERVSCRLPNAKNYLSGGFAARDDLSRCLPDSLVTGVYGSNGERYVGIFYFLWQGEHGDPGVYDLQKTADKYGELAKNADAVDPVTGERLYGAVGDMHWFSKPLYGYYYASDGWVVRKHMELLTNANIDFLFFDVTNGAIYKENALRVMEICHELNAQGFAAPQVVFYTNTAAADVMQRIYREIYAPGLYPDTWFYVDGKPCIIGVEEGNPDGFFTVKTAQWPNEPQKENSWPWMDFEWPQRVFNDREGRPSAINVSIAQHNRSVTFSDSSLYGYALNRGRSFSGESADDGTMYRYRRELDADRSLTLQGRNFQAQWDRALQTSPRYVLVTGWNEWVAQRQDGRALRGDGSLVYFVDTASEEFSRDAEMLCGGYFDNYYMQLIANIQRFKGSAPLLIRDGRKSIDLGLGFEQWEEVAAPYYDPSGDTADRSHRGFGGEVYEDRSGNNDIVLAKVTHDGEYLSFYVETAENISPPSVGQSWMQLLLNADGDSENGWYGYDFLVNFAPRSDSVTTVAACSSDAGRLVCRELGEIGYRVLGRRMMLSLPLGMLGIEDPERIYLEFKWVDAKGVRYERMEDLYLYGDCAPLGRLNWIYQNYVPERGRTGFDLDSVSVKEP